MCLFISAKIRPIINPKQHLYVFLGDYELLFVNMVCCVTTHMFNIKFFLILCMIGVSINIDFKQIIRRTNAGSPKMIIFNYKQKCCLLRFWSVCFSYVFIFVSCKFENHEMSHVLAPLI